MKKLVMVVVVLVLFCTSCSGPDIEITREYISNGDWKETKLRRAGFSVYEIIVPDTIIQDPNLTEFEFKKIISNYDFNYSNSFSCLTYDEFDLSQLNKNELIKIFFDRKQKGVYWSPYKLGKDYHIREKLSKLKINSWYRFDGLRPYWTFYAYVDKDGEVHVFKISKSAFGV
jgi:hypothetical protein